MASVAPRRGLTRWSTHEVVIDPALSQAQRRCVLAHELCHIERGPTPSDPWLHRREERAVRREAARRLISLDDLALALRWSRNVTELADELWVDEPTLRTRLAHLTPAERAWLDWTLT